MKFIKKIVADAKSNWDYLNEKQKYDTFLLMWEGTQIPNNRYINKIKNKLPGLHYKELYKLINQVIEKQEETNITKLEKELTAFYSQPVTPQQKEYYPPIKKEIHEKLYPLNKEWLQNKILSDITECEEIQKQRLMKRFGINK